MSSQPLPIPGLAVAPVDEKLALIDELGKAVRGSAEIEIRNDHIQELERRVAAISADPSLALTPAHARALLKK